MSHTSWVGRVAEHMLCPNTRPLKESVCASYVKRLNDFGLEKVNFRAGPQGWSKL
ncbi:Protein kinase domain-containing protein [Psidium guajava]|nr:Protein kinase domain-containing protein [Psidium guajava]